MVAYETPGVYYERVDAKAPAITSLRTDVTGFVGLAPSGPVDEALPVESFRQFQAHYGEFTGTGFLAYAVRGFFENGGRRCWIVRVAANEPNGGYSAAGAIFFEATATAHPAWRIRASSPGVWGNNLTVRLVETHLAQTVSAPAESKPAVSRVVQTAGFRRGTLARISQPGASPLLRVVSAIDAGEGLLYWLHPDPAERLFYDAPLDGFNPDQPLFIESVEYTLLVRQSGVPIFLRARLAPIPEHPNYGPRLLAPLVNPADLEAQRILPPTPNPVVIEELRERPFGAAALDTGKRTVRLSGGADGLALLEPYDLIGEPVSPNDSDEARHRKQRGLQKLALIDEVAIVAAPDIQIRPIPIPPTSPPPPCIPDPCLPIEPEPADAFVNEVSTELPPVFTDEQVYRMQAAMVLLCEDLKDRIAILDAPFSASRNDALGPALIRAWRTRFDSKYAALYYPWLRVTDPLRGVAGLTRDIPPAGHVAGQYARSDFEVGVHKAPANSPLVWTQDVTVAASDPTHGLLNTLGINLIKVLGGRGTRIMGARTVSSDPDWIFVNVRRLMMMIEKAIYISTQWAAFEPNDWSTRAKIQVSISSFLIALWQQGALAGTTLQEAFFVRCDDDNNPPRERDNGRLIAEVGVAPSKPFEFVVLRVGRQGNEFEIEEVRRTGGL